jgi:hypothetical protein
MEMKVSNDDYAPTNNIMDDYFVEHNGVTFRVNSKLRKMSSG